MKNPLKYPEYKDSDVVWLHAIPVHWKIVKAKRIFHETSIKNHPHEPLLAATQTKGVIPKSLYENTTVTATKNFETLKFVKKGDFVISLRSFQGGIEYAHYQGIISPAYTILEPQEEVVHKYYRYLLKSKHYISGLTLLVTGIREGQNIDTGKFKDSFLPLPPIDEQTQIAAFLDYKLAKIDRFILKKKQLIKLLNEQKAAIINQAVIKGFDHNASMKSSGIEWLGDIPEHWEVKKLKSFCKGFGRIGYRGYKTTDLVDKGEGAITISPSNIKDYFMIFDECTYLSLEKYEESPEIKIFNNDILMVKTGSTYGKVGIVKNLMEKATINPQLLVFKENKINADYLYLLLKSTHVQTQVQLNVIGSTIPTISQTKILNFKLVIPPIDEIESLLVQINNETLIIDKTISTIEKEITLTQEYKTALIAEAVTGKIDVREFEIPETQDEETYEDLEEELNLAAEGEAEYQNEEIKE